MHSKKYFDKVATSWDKMRTGFFSNKIIESIQEEMDIKTGIHILDVGSGSGFLTEAFINYDVHITALDQSQEMLNVMKDKLHEHKNVKYIQGDIENISLSDKYDYIMANMLLHHLEEPSRFIQDMGKHLKKGGKLIITDLDKHNHIFLTEEQNDRWMGFLRLDIHQWYKDAGFAKVKVDCTEANCKANSNQSDDYADITVFKAVGIL